MGMKPLDIFLVEDNEGDILLTREALSSRNMVSNLTVAKNGVEAIELLNEKLTDNARLPDMILLDINLPKKNGQEVLHYIKQHINLKQIPVIMLTTSSSESDIIHSYSHHANCYITKPVDVDSFMDVINKIESFWSSIVEFPRQKK
jgi:CheY-like chemotaxis protein